MTARLRTTLYFVTFFFVGFAAVLPAILEEMIVSHDVLVYSNWHRCFTEQLLAGEWYPRWLMDMNGGRGSPVFYFYPPLPYYVSAFIEMVLPVNSRETLALYLSFGLSLGLSGLTCFLMLKNYVRGRSAFVVSLYYMLAPYHLFVDLYYRFSYAEFWAFTWVPLIVHCLIGVLNDREFYGYWLSLSYSLLILTHLPSVIIVTPLIFIFILFHTTEVRRMFRCLIPLGTSYLLTALYVLPMISYQKFVSLGTMWQGRFSLERNLFGANSVFNNEYYFNLALVNIAMMMLILLLIRNPAQKPVLFWLVSAGLSLFLMFGASSFVWRIVPILHKIQFPWRLNLITLLSAVVLMSIILNDESRKKTTINFMLNSLLVGLVVAQVVSVVLQISPFRKTVLSVEDASRAIHEAKHRVGVAEYLPRWVSAEIRTSLLDRKIAAANSLIATSDNGELKVTERSPKTLKFESVSTREFAVSIRRFYFPLLQAHLDDGIDVLEVKPDNEGYVQVVLPPGRHRWSLRMIEGVPELLGKWISLLSISAMSAMLFYRRITVRRTRSGPNGHRSGCSMFS